ncbi:unnamed protein product [Rhizoctonia solani]|uniref:Solute carrier family 28 member 3 n=1 Tax=Rhizoctonia solani TaxID=456999 RepID=A0A8H3HLN6_9AGAM|nr:unnamed protein product [Rhizoctonia solani]
MDTLSPQEKRRSDDEKRDPELESGSLDHKPELDKRQAVVHDDDEAELKRERRRAVYQKYRPFILAAVALVILGWWISATVLEATRHRWIVQTFWAWSFIALIAFRFIPNSIVTRPVSAVWQPLISKPFFSLSYRVRLAMGWLALLGIVFGSAFGFPLPNGTNYGDRAISVFGLFVFTTGFWLSSKHRSQIPWPTVIVGLFMQQAIALFVLKTDAGFKIFLWIARLAADFLEQAGPAAGFFFDPETTAKHWFFVNTLGAIIFFIAFVQMMYYLGVMQWLIKQFAWFFFKTLNVSGAEAVVAAASPWIGQGESACLVRPFVDLMTESEIHLTMTSGFSTIAGSVFAAYVNMGVPGQNLVTSSVMSIPASIAISKLRIPEIDEPLTRGQVIIDQGAEDKHGRPANALHAFSKGATFGLIVAGQILCNVLTVLALVYTIDGLLTWIGKGFGIHELTLDLIFGYLFYPVTFLLGVPRGELLRVARLLATKLVANEFVAYQALKDQHAANPFSDRAYTIASYGLCGFANLGSLGIQIGVLGALAPSRGKVIARVAPSAMICGFLSTLQTAGIAGMLV